MAAFVRRIRRDFGPGKKICLFGDNAKINRSILVKESASRIDPRMAECRLLYNQPYRPDLVSIIIFIHNNFSIEWSRTLLDLLQAEVSSQDCTVESESNHIQQLGSRQVLHLRVGSWSMQVNCSWWLETIDGSWAHATRSSKITAKWRCNCFWRHLRRWVREKQSWRASVQLRWRTWIRLVANQPNETCNQRSHRSHRSRRTFTLKIYELKVALKDEK